MYIPGGFAHVVHEFTLVGDPEPIFTTYGVEVSSLSTTVANDLHGAFGDNWAALIGEDYTLTKAVMYTETVIYESTDAGIPCADNAESLPSNTACLVTKRSGFRGRKNVGRMFIPGVNSNNVTPNGDYEGTQLSIYQAGADAWLADVQAVAGVDNMVILHGTVADGAPTPVVSLEVSSKVATQRRRMR